MELKFEEQHSYTTFADHPQQGKMLHTIDYMNQLTEGIHTFPLCRAKLDETTSCGVYMPSVYWQKAGTSWRFHNFRVVASAV